MIAKLKAVRAVLGYASGQGDVDEGAVRDTDAVIAFIEAEYESHVDRAAEAADG